MAKAMKAMKAMAAMKAMRAMKKKPVSARTAKRQAFAGKIDKTNGGLAASSLVMNKNGKVVSKKMSARGKKSPWIAAVQKARAALKIKGFAAIKKGSPLYIKAKEIYKQ
jgi:hypothetical protein